MINHNLVEIRIPKKFSVCIFILENPRMKIQRENFFGILSRGGYSGGEPASTDDLPV
jgi:hypothetical protein